MTKPMKVFLQSREKDINGLLGYWATRNKEMAAALEFAGYDYKFVFGEGGHTLMHGGAIFPNTMGGFGKTIPKSSAYHSSMGIAASRAGQTYVGILLLLCFGYGLNRFIIVFKF